MALGFYLFTIIVSYLITIQVYSSAVVDDRYLPLIEMGNNDGQDHEQSDEQIFVAQRSAHFIFPPTSFSYPSSRVNEYRDIIPNKRHSFGRKHHWDAFFGRR